MHQTSLIYGTQNVTNGTKINNFKLFETKKL